MKPHAFPEDFRELITIVQLYLRVGKHPPADVTFATSEGGFFFILKPEKTQQTGGKNHGIPCKRRTS